MAKHKVLIILSSDYKEKLSMSLAFETWIDNSDSSLTVKGFLLFFLGLFLFDSYFSQRDF